MKTDDKAAWRPKRFDVAGAHPDEAWRAVAEAAGAVKELHAKCNERDKAFFAPAVKGWLETKPLRYGNSLDADVQRFLETGGQLIGMIAGPDRQWSDGQRQVHHRSKELAASMKNVLDSRPDEFLPSDPWRRVKVETAPATGTEPWDRVWSERETRQAIMSRLRANFAGGPREAVQYRAAYLAWEQDAERRGVDMPMNGFAKHWKRFIDDVDGLKQRCSATWAHVDINEGIDFRQALTQRPAFKSKHRVRM